jgi:hypothetical protein
MKPDANYLRKRTTNIEGQRAANERFWAHVRSVSEEIGYTDRENGGIRIPKDIAEIAGALKALGLRSDHVISGDGNSTAFGADLLRYLEFRARLLNETAKPLLMTAAQAKAEFIRCFKKYRPNPLSVPWNKQKDQKQAPAYLTGLVNMILSAVLGESSCDFDPLSLTTVTIDQMPFRTLARRVDGAFPGVVNPTAVWEIKEYYYTTTFGSRVADAIYETLLDGLELEFLEESPHGKIFHYLIIDAADTWWGQGNPYLCRLIDMLHMGYIDEVVFGREVEDAMTQAAAQWQQWRENRQHANAEAANEECNAGAIPPPKHKRLSPTERRKKAAKWNVWATANGLGQYLANIEESEEDKQVRLTWNNRRKISAPDDSLDHE